MSNLDRERMAQLGWRFQKRLREETGHEIPLYTCEKCEDKGFVYARRNGVTAATPCVCRLRRAFTNCDDDKKLRHLEQMLERTETGIMNGRLMPPSKVARLEYEEWKRRMGYDR